MAVKKAATTAAKAKAKTVYEVGQTLTRKKDNPVIVGKTTKGEWILENSNDWGELETFTPAQLDREFKILG